MTRPSSSIAARQSPSDPDADRTRATMLIACHPLSTLRLLLALPACAAVMAAPSPARAEVGGQVAAELDLGAPMDTTEKLAIGGGGRFGWRFGLGPIWLQPEAVGSVATFVYDTCNLCQTSDRAVRVTGGVRVGGSGLISGVIEPALFGHAGYGWVRVSAHYPEGEVISADRKGPAFDVGFALDVKAVRYFRFGVHGAYNVVVVHFEPPAAPTWAMKWITFGLHAGAAF